MANTYFSPLFRLFRNDNRRFFIGLIFLAGMFSYSGVVFGQTNTWDGSAGDNNWGTAANWSLDLVPTASHDVVISASVTINLGAGSYTINSLAISNLSTVILLPSLNPRTITIDDTGSYIEAGSSLTLNGASGNSLGIVFSGTNRTMEIAGSLILGSAGGGGKYSATGSITTVSGTLKLESTVSGALSLPSGTTTFEAGGTYEHAIPAGTIPLVTWDDSSTCLITGITNSIPSQLGQAYGNLVFNCTSMTSSLSLPFSGHSIAGNFEILSTGSGSFSMSQATLNIGRDFILSGNLNMASSTSRTLNVTGNFTMNGGTLNMSTGSGSGTININGDVSLNSGTINETSSGSGIFIFNKNGTQVFSSGSTITNIINFNVSNGTTLQMAAAGTVLGSGGTFTLNAGATLGVTSPDGITTSGATGNIQTTGSRVFTEGSHIIYNGTGNQNTGSGLAITNKANLTINNPGNTVTLSGTTVITGILTVTAGSTLALAGNTLSVPTEVFLECGATGGSDITGGQLTLGGNITVTNAAGAGTDNATISSTINLGANRTITLADDGSSATDLEISGSINGLFGIAKDGPGTLKLSGNNTYSGTTTINAGTVVLAGAAERIANTSSLILNGGTFSTGETTGFTEGMYTLTLTDNSTINLGTGSHTLTFANSSGVSWLSSKVLTITGWTGTIDATGAGTQGKIVVGVGGLSTSQLGQIQFSGYPQGAVITASGELVPKAKVFYSTSSSTPETPGNWNSDRDGMGTSAVASDFTTPGTYFIIQGSGNGGTTPHTMTTASSWTVSGANAKVQIENGASLIAAASVTIGSSGFLRIDNGGTYKHQNTSSWATSIFQGSESFGSSSTVEINATATTLPSNSTYGNLVINLTSDPGADLNFAGALTTINGSLTVSNTLNREVSLGTSSSASLAISSHLSISGGTSKFALTSGTGSPTITVNGNVTVSGGSLEFGMETTLLFWIVTCWGIPVPAVVPLPVHSDPTV